MTVEENLLMGPLPLATAIQAGDKARMYQLFPAGRAAGTAGSLSGGGQQMLAIARA